MKKCLLLLIFIGISALYVSAQDKYKFKIENLKKMVRATDTEEYPYYQADISWRGNTPSFKIDSVWVNGLGFAINYSYEKKAKWRRITYSITLVEERVYSDPFDLGVKYYTSANRKQAPILVNSGPMVIRYILNDKSVHYVSANTYTDNSDWGKYY